MNQILAIMIGFFMYTIIGQLLVAKPILTYKLRAGSRCFSMYYKYVLIWPYALYKASRATDEDRYQNFLVFDNRNMKDGQVAREMFETMKDRRA